MVVTHGLCKNTATHSIGWVSQVTETSLTSHFLPIPTLSQHWDLNLSGSSSGLVTNYDWGTGKGWSVASQGLSPHSFL